VNENATVANRGSIGVSILRITLGVIILATWWGNIGDDFYDGDNFAGFFDWAFRSAEEGGNGSSLGFVESIIDNTIGKAPEFFGWIQTIFEGFLGVALLVGGFTRLASLGALAFFTGLFLTYFGGEEWIWTYVILMASSLTVFLSYGGRVLGLDQVIVKTRGESPAGLLW